MTNRINLGGNDSIFLKDGIVAAQVYPVGHSSLYF